MQSIILWWTFAFYGDSVSLENAQYFSLFKCLCLFFGCCRTKHRNRNFQISNRLQTRSRVRL